MGIREKAAVADLPSPFDDDAGYHDPELGIQELDGDAVVAEGESATGEPGSQAAAAAATGAGVTLAVIGASAGDAYTTPRSTKFFYSKRSETRKRSFSGSATGAAKEGVQSLLEMRQQEHEWLKQEHEKKMQVLEIAREYQEKRLLILSVPSVF